MTRPTMANVILFLAAPTFSFSPPDIVHWIPPKIKKNKARRVATTNKVVTPQRTIAWTARTASGPPLGIPPTGSIGMLVGLLRFPPGTEKDKYFIVIEPLASSH